jgi:hypothetical protein
LNKCPVNALQNALLNNLLLTAECVQKVLDMRFYKENFSFFLLTQGVELKHLNEALTSFLYNTDFKLQAEHLNANVEVSENIVNEAAYLLLPLFHYFVEST